ncbi:MAG: PaaI family thioesterase [Caulobacteraceae bacterium]|nr:PaaI family thioesterase [Caulobacteraceae bacterium]
MAESEASPPAGFVAWPGTGFSGHVGPYFHGPDGAQAFFVAERHCNGLGLIHGGMISAFMDGVLAAAAARATSALPITMHLAVDYLEMGRMGHWLIGEGSLTKATGDVAFVEGRARIGARSVARATGVFKLMRRRLR